MGAHVFIVDSETFPVTLYRRVAAVVREKRGGGRYAEKTRADVLADLSCVREGDRIFFYEVDKGFHGVYKAVSTPFIDKDEIPGQHGVYLFGSRDNPHFVRNSLILPNRVLIRPEPYLEKTVNEWRSAARSAFGRFTSAIDLRSIFYKKALGRGKSITHLFPQEEKKLTDLLLKVNNGIAGPEPDSDPYQPAHREQIRFDLRPTESGEVKYEKILEGWIIQNIDNPLAGMGVFLGDVTDIQSFANYVPVSIAGGNLDVLVLHGRQGARETDKITIIELKKGAVADRDIKQLEDYVRWSAENLTKVITERADRTEISAHSRIEMIQPVLIGKHIADSALRRCGQYAFGSQSPILVTYTVNSDAYTVGFQVVGY